MLLFPAGCFRFPKKVASDACGYPDSPTRLLRAAPPSPLGTQIFNLWLRVLRTLLTATGSPLDAALCAEISKSRDEVKRCVECGAAFTPKSNRAKYCPDCAAWMRRKQEAERQRKRYLQATQLSR